MMRVDQADAIRKKLGNGDANMVIDTLNRLGVGENIELTDTTLSIPKALVRNINHLQYELQSHSKSGRSYDMVEEGPKLTINIVKLTPAGISECYFPENDLFANLNMVREGFKSIYANRQTLFPEEQSKSAITKVELDKKHSYT